MARRSLTALTGLSLLLPATATTLRATAQTEAAPLNPIQRENMMRGSPAWEIEEAALPDDSLTLPPGQAHGCIDAVHAEGRALFRVCSAAGAP